MSRLLLSGVLMAAMVMGNVSYQAMAESGSATPSVNSGARVPHEFNYDRFAQKHPEWVKKHPDEAARFQANPDEAKAYFKKKRQEKRADMRKRWEEKNPEKAAYFKDHPDEAKKYFQEKRQDLKQKWQQCKAAGNCPKRGPFRKGANGTGQAN